MGGLIGVAYSYYSRFEGLKKEHEEDVFISKQGIEFRKGKRTKDRWLPFCPKCHLPAIDSETTTFDPIAICSGGCGWKTAKLDGNLLAFINTINPPSWSNQAMEESGIPAPHR